MCKFFSQHYPSPHSLILFTCLATRIYLENIRIRYVSNFSVFSNLSFRFLSVFHVTRIVTWIRFAANYHTSSNGTRHMNGGVAVYDKIFARKFSRFFNLISNAISTTFEEYSEHLHRISNGLGQQQS